MSWENIESMKMLLFTLAETLNAFHIYLDCETHPELTYPFKMTGFIFFLI